MKSHVMTMFGGRREFKASDTAHTPYNKRRGQVQSSATMRVQHFTGNKNNPDGWLSVNISELVRHDSGRSVERVISMTLDNAARKALVMFLMGED